MSFVYSDIKCGQSHIHFLQFDSFDPHEYTDSLTREELERFHLFKHLNRKREFVATRVLRHQLFGFEHIHYDINGAPYVESEGYISVSHTKNLVGIALNKDFKIGLDLESYRPNILELKDKFLSEKEKQLFNIEDPIIVTKLWSAKEALYKLAGRKKILFSRELLLEPETDYLWSGLIINPDEKLKVKLNIFEEFDTVITINNNAIEQV